MSILSNEILTDPMALGYAPFITAGNHITIHALLNDKTRFTKLGWITVASFNIWCASHNTEYIHIETLASDNTSPYYSSAKSLLRCLTGSIIEGAINLADGNVFALLNVWPYIDTTSAAKNALISLGTYPASRADILEIDCSLTVISTTLNGAM
jgi:hypothetical protein